LTGIAPLRVSLAGGGTDLRSYYLTYSGIVVSFTVDLHIRCRVEPAPGIGVEIRSPGIGCASFEDARSPGEVPEHLEYPVEAVRWLRPGRGIKMELTSDVPPGSGLGSSGCVLVVVLGTLAALAGRPLGPRRLAELAYYIETHRLGSSAGKQDHYAAAYGGLKVYRFRRRRVDVDPLRLPPRVLDAIQGHAMLFSTGKRRRAAPILSSQGQACREGRHAVVDALHARRRLASEMIDALERGAVEEVGGILHRDWLSKRRISEHISSPEIDEAYETALEHGASGGRVVGAGGGGHFLLWVCPEKREGVRGALHRLGFEHVPCRLDGRGFRLEGDGGRRK